MSITFTVAEIQTKIDNLKIRIDDAGEQIAFWMRLRTMAKSGVAEPVVEEPAQEEEQVAD